jgi:hypothetical protein
MGTLTRLLLALPLLLAAPCWAQSEGKIFAAGKVLELVGPTLGQAVIAVELCGAGDAELWKRAAAAIDKRYAHCVAQDPQWKELSEKSGVPAGTWALDTFLRTRGAETRAQGAATYCSRVPWKMVLVPGAATEPAKEAFLRERPQIGREALGEFIAWAEWVRALGEDAKWIDAPCTDFWPAWPKK